MSDFFVFDTNNLISADLLPNTTSSKALDKAIDFGEVAIFNNTIDELVEVLFPVLSMIILLKINFCKFVLLKFIKLWNE